MMSLLRRSIVAGGINDVRTISRTPVVTPTLSPFSLPRCRFAVTSLAGLPSLENQILEVNNDKKKLMESMELAEELMERAERSGNTTRYQQLEARLVSMEARLTALIEMDTLLLKEKTALVEKDRLLAEANLLMQAGRAAIGMFPTFVAVYCFLNFNRFVRRAVTATTGLERGIDGS
jgi:hypothetical protein